MIEQFLENLKTRLPEFVLAQDPATSNGSWRMPLNRAISENVERISFNTSLYINAITIDYDDDAAFEEKWSDFDLPPSLSVVNKSKKRPGRHDTYFLATPVFVGSGGKQKPIAFARFLRRALTAEFCGDKRFTNRLTKNPWHSGHRSVTPWLFSKESGYFYEFHHFEKKIDLEKWSEIFKKEDAAKRSYSDFQLDDSARNASLFDVARQFAYSAVKSDQYSFSMLSDFVEDQNMLFIEKLSLSETRSITRSIDKFIKNRFVAGGGNADLQREKQKKSAAVRRAKSRSGEIVARLDAGETRAQIAKALGMTTEAVKKAAQRYRKTVS